MDTPINATDETKTALENAVTWYLSEKLSSGVSTIVSQKYLTNDNRLIYLTKCNIEEANVPRVKVQVLERVDGGIHETGYQLFGDHRLEKYTSSMIFGTQPGAADTTGTPVNEPEAKELLNLIGALQNSARALI